MRKTRKLCSEDGSCDGNKCKRGSGGAHGGVQRSLRLVEFGVWSQAVGFVLLHLEGIWLFEDVSTFNFLYQECL
jgi:hypothetical protein